MKSKNLWAALSIWVLVPFATAEPMSVKPSSVPSTAQAELLPPDAAFSVKAMPGAEGVHLAFHVAAGYYLYQQRISVQMASGGEQLQLRFPAAQTKSDRFFGEQKVYGQDFTVVALTAASKRPGKAIVHYQGCAGSVGVCYPPQTATIELR